MGVQKNTGVFEGRQGPEWAAATHMDGRMDYKELAKSRVTPYGLDTQSSC